MSDQDKKIKEKKKFTILLPPPNLTGSLHMGHALDFFLQHVLLLKAKEDKDTDVEWKVGFDHAGIATQILVEKELRKEGKKPEDMSDHDFLNHTQNWVESKRSAILSQIEKLGLADAADWKNGRFTMDDKYKEMVINAFVCLYKDGLIYRSERMVNWDCTLKTALSDLEVDHREVKGKLYYVKYKSKKGDYVTVATTRPETMFGDEAVMLHPKDKRTIGTTLIIPISGKEIPVIRDEAVDMEYGSGVVKVTPAHDFNDFEVGKKHNLPFTVIIDQKGKLCGAVPSDYQGLDRFEARKKVLAQLEAMDLLEKIEPCKHDIPYGDRSDSILEPRITEQWFLDSSKMAGPVLGILDGAKFSDSDYVLPVHFSDPDGQRDLRRWLTDIEPWCLSRQIRWGHQIPAWWYEEDGKKKYVVATSEAEAKKKVGKNIELIRDKDVLDTWFSSALWPMAVLGWDGKSKNWQHERYPFNWLTTGRDILFFWVARMMMMCVHFTGKNPFKKIDLHPIFCDSKGQKMSKSKGNVTDLIEMVNQWGLDAVRWALISKCHRGLRTMKLSDQDFVGARNLITKLENAVKFCISCWDKEKDGSYSEFLKKERLPIFFSDEEALAKVVYISSERIAKLDQLWCSPVARYMYAAGMKEGTYSFGNEFAKKALAIRKFFWNDFCDFYIEYCKVAAIEQKEINKFVLLLTCNNILFSFSPFIPSKSNELRKKFNDHFERSKWPLISIFADDAGLIRATAVVREIESCTAFLRAINSPFIQKGRPLSLDRIGYRFPYSTSSWGDDKYDGEVSSKWFRRACGFRPLRRAELPRSLDIDLPPHTFKISYPDDMKMFWNLLKKQKDKLALKLVGAFKKYRRFDVYTKVEFFEQLERQDFPCLSESEQTLMADMWHQLECYKGLVRARKDDEIMRKSLVKMRAWKDDEEMRAWKNDMEKYEKKN